MQPIKTSIQSTHLSFLYSSTPSLPSVPIYTFCTSSTLCTLFTLFTHLYLLYFLYHHPLSTHPYPNLCSKLLLRLWEKRDIVKSIFVQHLNRIHTLRFGFAKIQTSNFSLYRFVPFCLILSRFVSFLFIIGYAGYALFVNSWFRNSGVAKAKQWNSGRLVSTSVLHHTSIPLKYTL